MPRRYEFEDGPPPEDGDRRPWRWLPNRDVHDPQFGFSPGVGGQWVRVPADPEDPVPMIDDD